ncbi:MAG: hypothetical protein ACTHU0_39580 [Kofleriaceae bacterium]
MPDAAAFPTKRLCTSCREPLEPGVSSCPRCDRVHCPDLSTWPADLRRLVTLLVLARCSRGAQSEQAQWERLFTDVLRGQQYGSVMLRFASDAGDCFPVLLGIHEAWRAAGSPTDLTAVAKLLHTFRMERPAREPTLAQA